MEHAKKFVMNERKTMASIFSAAGGPSAFLGGRLISAAGYLRYLTSVSAAVLWQALRPLNWRRSVRREFMRQCYFTGARALPFVAILALLVGLGMVFEILFWLDIVGQEGYVGRLMVLLLVREIAPILVALVVIGRSGAAILAELGNMRIAGQVRMLDALGLDPFIFMLLPRVIAVMVCTFCLTVTFLALALGSGFILAHVTGIATVGILDMVNEVLRAVEPDEFMGIAMNMFFSGLVIGVICCTNGLGIGRDPTEVPRMLPRTFAQCVIALFTISICISFAL